MARFDNVRLHLRGSGDGGVEVVDLEPEKDSVPIGLILGITDSSVVVCDLEVVELEDQGVVRDQSLVFRAAVVAPTAEETLVPAAACFDVGDGNQGLRTHGDLHSQVHA
jgi:hypothetical protein